MKISALFVFRNCFFFFLYYFLLSTCLTSHSSQYVKNVGISDSAGVISFNVEMKTKDLATFLCISFLLCVHILWLFSITFHSHEMEVSKFLMYMLGILYISWGKSILYYQSILLVDDSRIGCLTLLMMVDLYFLCFS